MCVAQSLNYDNLPRKVKVSVMSHRFRCKLGLCREIKLMSFHFKEEELGVEQSHKSVVPFVWTSGQASLNIKKLMKYNGKSVVKVTVLWRIPFDGQPPPVYIPMSNLLHQVWDDATNDRPFVYDLWIGDNFPSPQAKANSVEDKLKGEELQEKQPCRAKED